MKRVYPLIALLALLIAPPALAQAGGGFASIMDDLPLMAGLSETGEGVAFETPGGRIAETRAMGQATADQVFTFYAETLPQLGWSQLSRGQFEREGEVLSIEVSAVPDGRVSVRLEVAPKGAGN